MSYIGDVHGTSLKSNNVQDGAAHESDNLQDSAANESDNALGAANDAAQNSDSDLSECFVKSKSVKSNNVEEVFMLHLMWMVLIILPP